MPAPLRVGTWGSISATEIKKGGVGTGRWKAQARLSTPDRGLVPVARTGRSAREARRLLSEYLQEYAGTLTTRGRRDMTVGALADEWIAWRYKQEAPRGDAAKIGTVDKYEVLVRTAIKPALGRARLEHLTRRTCQEMLDGIADAGQTARARTARTVLREILAYGVQQDYLSGSTKADLETRPVKRSNKKQTPPTPEQVRLVLRAALRWQTEPVTKQPLQVYYPKGLSILVPRGRASS